MALSTRDKTRAEEYVIATMEVDPDTLLKLDTKMSSREKDGITIKMPSQTNICAIQLWEVYLAVCVLCSQPHSNLVQAHVRALCNHDEATYLVESLLKEFLIHPNITETTQDCNLFSFFEEYIHRKFQINFSPGSILKYVTETVDDTLCGHDDIPRSYLLAPFIQAFLTAATFWEGQYDELIDAMRMINLPVNDVILDGDEDIGETIGVINWDNAKLYDDPTLILKKYGGWAIGKTAPMLTKKDQLVMRLTGCTLEQLLSGKDVPDSPREDAKAAGGGALAIFDEDEDGEVNDDDSDQSSHASDYQVDPEHPRIVPFGLSLAECYVLLRGLLMGTVSKKKELHGCVVRQRMHGGYMKDSHILAAATLVDLYMREQIDVHHWTLQEGSVAVPFKALPRKGYQKLDHFLDHYTPHTETIFRDMLLPSHIGDAAIWDSIEKKGIVDNHRLAREHHIWGYRTLDVFDLARPDILLDMRDGYVVAARVLYDKQVVDPTNEEASDVLMFVFLLQYLFDVSMESINGMARVLQHFCPPFQKGELFPPLQAVHAGSVCMGVMDRASRVAKNQDTQLASEAAEFNEVVMTRLEEKFFLSPKVFESMDEDQSGELSIDEFVEGMKGIDVYKDFRRERVPEDVLRMIVSDLAERLFQEVDVNMDGTLTMEEIGAAFRRRREEALKNQQKRQWFRNRLLGAAQTLGIRNSAMGDDRKKEAIQEALRQEAEAKVKEQRRRMEWNAEVERLELRDEQVDVDTGLVVEMGERLAVQQ